MSVAITLLTALFVTLSGGAVRDDLGNGTGGVLHTIGGGPQGTETTPQPGSVDQRARRLFEVVGLDHGESLNVRNGIDRVESYRDAPVIGRLHADARVIGTGLRHRLGDTLWHEIQLGGGTGWVIDRYIKPASYDAVRTEPFDQAATNESFAEYRERLIRVVQERDFEKLKPFLSPHIQLSFAGHAGFADFRAFLQESPELWDRLGWVLRHGGRFQTNAQSGTELFIAPYMFFAEPPGTLDPYEFVIVADSDVPVHVAASDNSPVLDQVSYAALPLAPDGYRQEWQDVQLPNGTIGYIAHEFLYYPTDYRAGFEQIEGEWKMVFFLAGD